MPYKMSRAAYAAMFGPTVGDKVRLADTELFIEVEKDFTTYGEEVKFGGGKVIRDGMGQSQVTRAEGAVEEDVCTVGQMPKLRIGHPGGQGLGRFGRDKPVAAATEDQCFRGDCWQDVADVDVAEGRRQHHRHGRARAGSFVSADHVAYAGLVGRFSE